MPLTIIQSVILGALQGITEWLPISSSAVVVFMLSRLYEVTDPGVLVRMSLFFHMGTFFSALIYFRKEVIALTKKLLRYNYSDTSTKNTIKFLFFATVVSGLVGIVLLKLFVDVTNSLELTGKTISLAIGVLLLFTGVLQLKTKHIGTKRERDLRIKDGLLVGVAQGLAVLPGISRSGITISTLLLKRFNNTTALRLSFVMSLPIVFFGNIILNLEYFAFSTPGLYGILASFVFGLLTIHALMKLSKKINFGWFVILFALLMGLSVFV